MELNDLLRRDGIEPETVIVMRHCPREPRLRAVLPWLVEDNHKLFNAYQQTQGPKVEKAFQSASYLASFIGIDNGKAIFAGLYRFGEATKMSYREFWANKELLELHEKFEMMGMEDTKGTCLWFDLKRTKHFDDWRGKLIINWPGRAISYWRWAARNKFDIYSISEESNFIERMPPWEQIILSHAQLENLPRSWCEELKRWRGIYYIFDTNSKKGYVGSAYGRDNIYQRWSCYLKSGHGGNKNLKGLDPESFKYSILQILPHDMPEVEVCPIEASWKNRLHSRSYGLNAN